MFSSISFHVETQNARVGNCCRQTSRQDLRDGSRSVSQVFTDPEGRVLFITDFSLYLVQTLVWEDAFFGMPSDQRKGNRAYWLELARSELKKKINVRSCTPFLDIHGPSCSHNIPLSWIIIALSRDWDSRGRPSQPNHNRESRVHKTDVTSTEKAEKRAFMGEWRSETRATPRLSVPAAAPATFERDFRLSFAAFWPPSAAPGPHVTPLKSARF